MQFTFSPSNPGVPSLPSLPGIPCWKHHIWSWWFWQMLFIRKMFILFIYLQVPLWVRLPQEFLWGQFYPVQRHTISHSSFHMSVHMSSYRCIYLELFTYNFSFWSFESLRPLFSDITLETSDETHTAIHWWDQPSLLAANCYQELFLFWCAWQTRRDSLSSRWCRRCQVCLWNLENPGDKQRKTYFKCKKEIFASPAWRHCTRRAGLYSRSHLLCLLQLPSGPVNPWDHVGPENKALEDC